MFSIQLKHDLKKNLGAKDIIMFVWWALIQFLGAKDI